MTEHGLYIPDGYVLLSGIYRDDVHEILKAKRKSDQREVVLKVSRPSNNDILKISKLSHEYHTLKNLDHEGVIRVLGLHSKNKSVCIVEEFFEGETLKSRIFNQAFTVPAFFQVALQLTDILAYVHSQGVIHKDINSSNILISKDNKVKLIDFGISTHIMNEEQDMVIPDLIEGTLTYISPEQTGRTSYSISAGSDLYSLGIVFYEMLSGKPPFDSADALEVIHFHLSRTPAPLGKVLPRLPSGLEKIIAELLEKNPDDRYQSAGGLHHDLKLLQGEIESGKASSFFKTRTNDKGGRFRKAQRLYGREQEVASIISCYENLHQTRTMLVLVSGYSGVGKSAVVKQLQRPVTDKNGLFISGKFDQFKRNIPYFAFIEAFDNLLRGLLAESDDKIKAWKEKIWEKLGANASLISEVIPSLEFITGKLPLPEKLPPAEQEFRFRLVLLDFIYCFSTTDRPLVIFLDDLQWADLPSLNLIERILSLRRSENLLIVGAYRSNEVNELHPLSMTIHQIKGEQVKVMDIRLQPLDQNTTIQIVADSFGMPEAQATDLGLHVYAKTKGNPFFINRFLQSLYDNKYLTLDASRKWTWDRNKIESLSYTDNVIDLMANEMTSLPETSREAMKYAAVLGNTFNLSTLSMVMEKNQNQVYPSLLPALKGGYILPLDQNYRALSLYTEGINEEFETESENLFINFRFLHDRVQQSAYGLIAPGDRETIHFRTANLLYSKSTPEKLNDFLFDIANHFSLSKNRVFEQGDRRSIAALYLNAGSKAKDSTSYDVAIKYLSAARDLLPEQSWQSDYELTFAVYSALGESEYLNSNHEKAEYLFEQILKYARTNLEKLKIYYVHSALYLKIGNTKKSLELGREAMKLYNIHFPESEWAIKSKATWELAKYLFLFSTRYRNVEKLYHLKDCTDQEIIAINQFLIDIATSAYQENQNLMVIIVLRIIRHYLKYGFTDASGWGFSGFSVIAYSGIGLSKRGLGLWSITRKLHQRTRSAIVRTKLDYTVNAFYTQWTKPLTENLDEIINNVKACLMNGDPNFAGYSIALQFWKKSASGLKLTEVLDSTGEYLEYLKNNKNVTGLNYIIPSVQAVKALIGKTPVNGDWNSEGYDEPAFAQQLNAVGNKTNIAFFYNFKLPLYYYFDKYEEGLQWAEKGDALQAYILGHYFLSEWYFYYNLLIASLYEKFSTADKSKYLKIFRRNSKWFRHWIKGCTENFEQQLYILKAEEMVMEGQVENSIRWYEKAIEAALSHGFTQFAAIANERAAKHLAGKGILRQSAFYLKAAYEWYEDWNAFGKCRQLKGARPDLFGDKIIQITGNTRTNLPTAALDYGSLIKASNSISSKIKLDELIQRLMNVLLENAGADRGVLMIPRQGELFIIAEGKSGPDNIQGNIQVPVKGSNKIPQSLINYCWNTQETKALSNALRDEAYSNDPYVMEHQVRSMIGIPLSNKGNKVGLIYLENKLLEGVFTSNKLEVLNMLSGQIGISIDNALLYETLESKVTERTRDLEKQKQIAESQTREAIQQKMLADEERKKSDALLLNILPDEIAQELKLKGESQARQYHSVTVIFTDFVNFTTVCEYLPPAELVAELNKCFAAFDKIVDGHGLEKIKTIGDAYLAASGLPRINPDHATHACRAAMDILNWVRAPENKCLFNIRIGINSGPVIAGIVGMKKYVYDIWGDTVNTAARMESSSSPGKINISESTYQLVKEKFNCVCRGKIEAKNKGSINMYFLEENPLPGVLTTAVG
ncbi:MAG TPA: adenylate/guanylate cyclase domain-containing protein [Saprospiraceae bacterium]|nr:adenylate/guanylate cyclase domain-containing protein [Saprospiraceae bacterium]HNT21172.1 adenylate/guanylate cyclase domain-containing protein [Saprospiraceae bacterium]